MYIKVRKYMFLTENGSQNTIIILHKKIRIGHKRGQKAPKDCNMTTKDSLSKMNNNQYNQRFEH